MYSLWKVKYLRCWTSASSALYILCSHFQVKWIVEFFILQTSQFPLMQTLRFPGKQGVPSCTWSANFLEKYKPNNPLGVQCNSHGET